MALYAIGDVQGNYSSLRRLLKRLGFDPACDVLWFTGDLVNRGPQSAEVLRYVAGLGERAVTVLGNHDLHLLAVAAGAARLGATDTFQDVLQASDSEGLLTWLASRPLIWRDDAAGYTLVHAGLLPQWSTDKAAACAREVEALIASRSRAFFERMYGDDPLPWDDALEGWVRYRLIVNALTRLRYCDGSGRADYRHKGAPGTQPAALTPWFQVPGRASRAERVVFGHWSTLGLWDADGVVCLDTGCCWGGRLSAIRLTGGPRQVVSVECPALG